MKHLLAIILLVFPIAVMAQTDSGMEMAVEGSHKLTKQLSVAVGAEVRTCDNFSAWDRGALSVDGTYKLSGSLKVTAGYIFLYDQNEEKINRDSEGLPRNWRPSYFSERHRFHVSLTGNMDVGRLNLSLRERWQYTYRPEKTRSRYDFEDEVWEDKIVASKAKNVLRSRLQAEYNIRKCPATPFLSAELYNAWSVEKVRYVAGVEWKLSKKHSLNAFYRYQDVRGKDEDEPNRHTIGFGYQFKL